MDKKRAVKEFALNKAVYMVYLLYLILFISLVTIFNKLSTMDGLLFFLFQIGGILLPGTAMVLTFCKDESISPIEFFAFSYAGGYTLNIVLYFLTVPFQLQTLVLPVLLLLDAYGVFQIKKKKNMLTVWIKRPDNMDLAIWGGFIGVLLIIVLVLYCGNNLLPTAVNENAYYTDLLYWIGDTVELSHNFPPQHFRNVNQPYFYHYFSSVQLAVMHLATKINVAELSLVYSCFQPVILLVSSAFLLFRENIRTKNKLFMVLGMVALFLTTGNEADTAVNYVSHLYKVPFGFDLSMAFGMFAFFFLLRQCKREKWDGFYFLMTVLCYFTCLGTKGPIGMLVLGGLGLICLHRFFVKRQFQLSVLYGVTLLIISAVLVCFILIATNSSVSSTFKITDDIGRTANNGYVGEFFMQLYYSGVPWIIARGLQVVYFAFNSQFAVALIFFAGLILKLFDFRKIDYIDVTCAVMALTGCLLTLITSHPTFSQTYFIMATYPYATLFGIRSLADSSPDILEKKGAIKKGTVVFKIVLVLFSIVIGVKNFFTCYYFKLGWNIGIANYQHNSAPMLEVSKTPLYNYVSEDDYEAYVWIREHTDWSDLFTSNLCLDPEIPRPYCLGALSERHVLMDDLQLIENLMNNKRSALRKIQNGGKIDYIVWYKWISPEFDGEGLGLNSVFENNGIVIYEVE